MSKPSVSMLRLAVKQLKQSKPEKKEETSVDALEQAMTDFQNATSSSERAAAFRAALELAKPAD